MYILEKRKIYNTKDEQTEMAKRSMQHKTKEVKFSKIFNVKERRYAMKI